MGGNPLVQNMNQTQSNEVLNATIRLVIILYLYEKSILPLLFHAKLLEFLKNVAGSRKLIRMIFINVAELVTVHGFCPCFMDVRSGSVGVRCRMRLAAGVVGSLRSGCVGDE